MSAVLKPAELIDVATLTGTPGEVSRQLGAVEATQVVALALRHGSAATAEVVGQVLERLPALIGSIVERRQQAALESIVAALVPQVPPPRHLLAEARMTASARQAVLESADWLTAAQLAQLAGFSATNPSAQPNRWKKSGQIHAIRHDGIDYFPGYALDAQRGYRPLKGLAEVLAAFGDTKDGWGLATWFASANSFLGGQRPMDLLATDPAQVAAAARDEADGVLHG